MTKIKSLLFAFAIVFFVSSCKFSKIRRSTDLREKYEAAIAYYDDKEYYKASILLEEIIPLIRGTKESEIAQFYFAYCNYYLSQLEAAAVYFQRFYETFRASKYVPEARYMHVKSLYENSPSYNLDQTSTYEAITVTQSFLNAYPNSEFYEECNKILRELRVKLEKKAYENAKLYYRIGNFNAAIVTFTNFQRSFPDSDYGEEIAFLKLEAQYKYAEQSTQRRQRERYNEALSFYDYLLDFYPATKYKKSADRIQTRCTDQLSKLN